MPSALRASALAAVAATLLLAGCLQDDVTPTPARYRTAVERVMAQYHVLGALVSVNVPGDAPWRQPFGYADLAARAPMDPASFFPIRSITKSYTVTLVLQLVRDGRLSLDDRLESFVPGFPNGKLITLADLAGMQSGIADYSANPAFLQRFVTNPAGAFTESELAAYGLPGSPKFAPAAEYEYSNTNTVLLGMVVEQVTGQPLGAVLQARILTPLGLSGTTYPLTLPLPAPHATPYDAPIDGGAAEVLPAINPTSMAGAGAMVTTLADLEIWGGALGDGRLIGPQLQQVRMDRSRPATNGPEYERYGLGIGMLKGWWGHTGSGVGWQAATFRDPRTGAVIAVVVNETPSGGRRNLNVAQELFAALADVVAQR